MSRTHTASDYHILLGHKMRLAGKSDHYDAVRYGPEYLATLPECCQHVLATRNVAAAASHAHREYRDALYGTEGRTLTIAREVAATYDEPKAAEGCETPFLCDATGRCGC